MTRHRDCLAHVRPEHQLRTLNLLDERSARGRRPAWCGGGGVQTEPRAQRVQASDLAERDRSSTPSCPRRRRPRRLLLSPIQLGDRRAQALPAPGTRLLRRSTRGGRPRGRQLWASRTQPSGGIVVPPHTPWIHGWHRTRQVSADRPPRPSPVTRCPPPRPITQG